MEQRGVNVGSNQNTYLTVVGRCKQDHHRFGDGDQFARQCHRYFRSVRPGDAGRGDRFDAGSPFTFTDVSNAAVTTYYESNTITVNGIDTASPVTITGGEYSQNGGVFVSTSGTALNGHTFKARGISSASNSTAVNVTLTIGGVPIPSTSSRRLRPTPRLTRFSSPT